MMDIKVTIDDKDNFVSFIRRFADKATGEINKETINILHIIRNHIIQSMRNTSKDMSKSYKRGNKIHHPSLPGNPPAIDRGDLIRNILTPQIGANESKLKITSPYINYLEDGTKKMEARPSVEPAIEENTGLISEKLKHAIMRSIY